MTMRDMPSSDLARLVRDAAARCRDDNDYHVLVVAADRLAQAQRESGYYWVEKPNDARNVWSVAEYWSGEWYVPGASAPVAEGWFVKIGPHIDPPASRNEE